MRYGSDTFCAAGRQAAWTLRGVRKRGVGVTVAGEKTHACTECWKLCPSVFVVLLSKIALGGKAWDAPREREFLR